MAWVTAHMSSMPPACTPRWLWLRPWRSPRCRAPSVGLIAVLAQNPAGRITEPTTWLPMAAGTMPAPTAAADPDDDPPGVRAGSNGLVVGPGWEKPSSVVTVLPRMTAPARRSAWTQAESSPVVRPA